MPDTAFGPPSRVRWATTERRPVRPYGNLPYMQKIRLTCNISRGSLPRAPHTRVRQDRHVESTLTNGVRVEVTQVRRSSEATRRGRQHLRCPGFKPRWLTAGRGYSQRPGRPCLLVYPVTAAP